MELNNEYIKEKLSHVYWLNGSPCSGKTTMTEKLVKDYGFVNVRDDIMKYRTFTNKEAHPNLQYPNPKLDWDQWFNRPSKVQLKWLHGLGKEFLDFLIVDLLSEKTEKKIVVDLAILADEIIDIIPKERMICFFTTPEEVKRLYLFREDHKMILERIKSDTKDPETTIINASQAMADFGEEIVESCEKFGIKTVERTKDLNIDEQFNLLKNYFKL